MFFQNLVSNGFIERLADCALSSRSKKQIIPPVEESPLHSESADGGQRLLRVLLCDDSKAERLALSTYLRRQGYEIVEADSGRSAIENLKAQEFDAILLDLQMPGVDGFDVLGYLQEHRRGLAVMLLSGMPVDQIQQKIHGLPTRELPPLFLKPVDLDQLLHVLELQLSGKLPDLSESTDATEQTDPDAV